MVEQINISIPKDYQKTEVGIIPNDWEIKPLGDVSFMKGRIGWQGLNETEFTSNPEEPFLITGMNFKDGRIRWDEVYHVSWQRYDIAKEIQLKIDDVLMTKDGTIGKVLFVDTIPFPHKATLNSHLLVFRPLNNNYYPIFLYYQLTSKTFTDFIELNKSGTTFFGISQGSVSKYNAILPTITEQTAIATALSDTDVLIENLKKLITKKRLIKHGAMQQLLHPKQGWVLKRLGDLFEITSSKRVFQKEWKNEGIPFYRARELAVLGEKGFVDNELYITVEMYEAYKKLYGVPEIGDILVTGVGTLGKTFVVRDNTKFYFKDGNIIWFKIRGSINSSFLQQLFLTKFITKQIEDNSAGTTVGTYTISGAQRTIVPFPPMEEQNRIATILTDMNNEIEALNQKLHKYRMIKQGMMQVLLTGKIRLL